MYLAHGIYRISGLSRLDFESALLGLKQLGGGARLLSLVVWGEDGEPDKMAFGPNSSVWGSSGAIRAQLHRVQSACAAYEVLPGAVALWLEIGRRLDGSVGVGGTLPLLSVIETAPNVETDEVLRVCVDFVSTAVGIFAPCAVTVGHDFGENYVGDTCFLVPVLFAVFSGEPLVSAAECQKAGVALVPADGTTVMWLVDPVALVLGEAPSDEATSIVSTAVELFWWS